MDNYVRNLDNYKFLKDLPERSKKLLAKFEGFSNISEWLDKKQADVDAMVASEVSYNAFESISWSENCLVIKNDISIAEFNQLISENKTKYRGQVNMIEVNVEAWVIVLERNKGKL